MDGWTGCPPNRGFESFQKAKDNLKAFQAASPVKSLAAMETPKGMVTSIDPASLCVQRVCRWSE